MATERRVKNGIMAALLCAGVLLVALPWIEQPAPSPLPPVFAAGSAAHLRLLGCIRSVDDCCRQGDVAAFRSAVTTAYASGLEAQLRQLDRGLDGTALLGMVADERHSGLLGELQCLQFAAGGSRGNLAAMVYDYGAGPNGGQAVFDGLKLVRLRWDGYAFRLDQVRDVRRRSGIGRDELVRQLLRAALEP